MPRILLAGLPGELEDWLPQRLKGTAGLSAQVTHGGEETLAELARGECELLIMDHRLENPPAADVLRRARSELGLKKMRVFYCVEKDNLSQLSSSLAKSLAAEDRMLLHPLEREKLAQETAAALGSRLPKEGEQRAPAEEEVTEAAAGLWEEFKGLIFEQLETLEQVTTALLEGNLSKDLRQKAEREAHKLAGSLGSLGLVEGTRLARQLEQLLEAGVLLGQAESLRICDAVVALRGVLDRGPTTHASTSLPSAPMRGEDEGPLLLVVQADAEFARQVVMEAAHWGLRAETAPSLAAARDFISRQTPSAVLLDPALPDGEEKALAFIPEVTARCPAVPILVSMGSDSFANRLTVARLGAYVFLGKPLPARQVIDSVAHALNRAKTAAVKILAVDDDALILESLRLLLEPQRMRITTLSDPLRFWDTLESTAPDVLLLDVEMPHLSGIELCRVLRNDARWGGIPVLFLTAHTDSDTVEKIFAAGGDDYVSKPPVGPELVTRISTRIDRTQALLSVGESGVSAGVSGLRSSIRVLDQLLRMARRHKQALCVVVLQVDEFDRIREMRGEGAADRVFRRVGQLLLGAFRSEDVVTRWEGDEFVVGMYGTRRTDGVQRLAELLEALRQEKFTGGSETPFRVTFSAGVAQYPNDGPDLRTLYRNAGEARDQARSAGGDRVLPAGWRPAAGDTPGQPDVVVVDDDETLTGLLLYALQTRGYRVERFHDGQAAVDALSGANPALRPRVLLLDVDLPSLDGLSILRSLTESGVGSRTRIIMLTARSSESEVVKALEWGAFDHVAKPFSLPVLMQRVRRALEA